MIGGPAQAVMVGAWACTPLCLFLSSSCLPAAELKDNKNKANPLDTTNPEGKKGIPSNTACINIYIDI
jgi:hypothetical protein